MLWHRFLLLDVIVDDEDYLEKIQNMEEVVSVETSSLRIKSIYSLISLLF